MRNANFLFQRCHLLIAAIRYLKELRHDILSNFFDGLSHGLSVGKPKTNGLLIKEKTKGVILKQAGTSMAEDGEDWNGFENDDLEKLS